MKAWVCEARRSVATTISPGARRLAPGRDQRPTRRRRPRRLPKLYARAPDDGEQLAELFTLAAPLRTCGAHRGEYNKHRARIPASPYCGRRLQLPPRPSYLAFSRSHEPRGMRGLERQAPQHTRLPTFSSRFSCAQLSNARSSGMS